MNHVNLQQTVKEHSNKELGIFLQRFFKTGKGGYAEGDVFAGIKVPESRKIATKFKDLKLPDLQKIIKSKIHEERLIALFILVNKFKRRRKNKKKDFYFLFERIRSTLIIGI